jgi:(1->4)-alpha-D-glucan 1-alpha-D-glucosylmutase
MMAPRTRINLTHIPVSTYRLQLNRDFTFRQASDLVDYLHELGIGDYYLSPILMTAPGSPHGYDVTCHSKLNPEIGTLEEFRDLSRRLKEHGMGLIADVVPNHMAIGDPSNEWWWAVLENGPSSRFAHYFDIDWHPPKTDLTNKVLCPILGDQYGRVLEDQQISVVTAERGGFCIAVYDKLLPLAARSWTMLLEPTVARLREQLGDDHEHVLELESLLAALCHLAPSDEKDEARVRERQRETEIVRRRLVALADVSEVVREAIEACRKEFNGTKGVPRSFDRLEDLLAQQSYRLCYWRVASDEINYRRFFDVNNLAAIRVEDREVFAAVHALMFELVHEGHVDGFRVDHPDGLLDPTEYFHRLQAGCMSATGKQQPFFIVGEKILAGTEELRSDWDIEGTTGYDFLGILNGLFVDRNRRQAFQHLYEAFTGWSPPYADLVYGCKRLILQTSMASELNLLTNKLDRISEQHRWSRDFTRQSLRHALRETIACFPIYRTYTTELSSGADAEDERYIRLAIGLAKRRNPSTSESIFDFLQSVLLLDDPYGIDHAQRTQRRQFVLSFQQFTGPVMAKGLEDTAFYRHTPLASLNEVGGRFGQFGTTPADFHALNVKHLASWPNTLLATSTHDSKRSEDTRARLNVLSEIPAEWDRAIRQWRAMNSPHKTELAGAEVPSPAEEYSFYQDLVGIWPLEEPTPQEYEQLIARFQAYMQKALREAKLHTSWINPNESYEHAVESFVAATLDPRANHGFLEEFRKFVGTLFHAGMWNSLSQTLLKIASPGVPDFYQGSEIWNFSLVDPDNRRPVDYALRRNLLRTLRTAETQSVERLVEQLIENPSDGAIKLYVTRCALRFRKINHRLLSTGSYIPLRGAGKRQNHVVAFARTLGPHSVIAMAGRLFMGLGAGANLPLGVEAWGDSVVLLRKECRHAIYRDIFTQRMIEPEVRKGRFVLPLAKVFSHLPVALLESAER